MRSPKKRTPRVRCRVRGRTAVLRSLSSVKISGNGPRRGRRQLQGSAPNRAKTVPRGVHEVVGDRARAAVRDPLHRVDDVLVEAGEEAEAVLAGQVSPRAAGQPAEVDAADVLPGSGAGDDDAAGLAARDVAQFEDADGEAALAQLVGGAQSTDAAAEHDHRLGHRRLLRSTQRVHVVGVEPLRWSHLPHADTVEAVEPPVGRMGGQQPNVRAHRKGGRPSAGRQPPGPVLAVVDRSVVLHGDQGTVMGL